MAKKSFIGQGNPALQFITPPAEKQKSGMKAAGNAGTDGGKETSGKKDSSARQDAPLKASQDISAAGETREKILPEAVRRPVAPRRQGESKSKRVQLLMPPSLHMNVSRRAAAMDMSFNEYVNQILEKTVNKDQK